jgi:Glycosyltransferases involved in cell wall biogenesis
MIVKNEEKYLRRCLEALVPIMEQVSSELIIADTGSTDNTVNIAKEFTKNVFHFEWCDDFAKARNSTLEKAAGEWYMQIDADEILTDAKPLIDFFNSGEYKQYNSAYMIIRSSNDFTFNSYIDNRIARIFKITENAFYTGSIHEYISQCPPTKDLALIAKHYGYIFVDNKEYVQEKCNKYLKLLFSELDKNRHNSMLYFYISSTYDILEDRQEGLKYSSIGLKYANETQKYIHYANIIKFNYQLNQYAEVVDYANKYFALKKTTIGTDIDIYALIAYAYANLKNSSEAIDAFEKYINLYKEYKKGLLNTPDIILRPAVTSNEQFYNSAIITYSELLVDKKSFELAKNQLYSINIKDLLNLDTVEYWLNLEINLMMNTNNFTRAYDLKTQLNDATLEKLQNIIKSELQRYFAELSLGSLNMEYVNGVLLTYTNLFSLFNALSKEELTENNIHKFSEAVQIGFYCLMAEKAKRVKDYDGYIKYLRILLKLCPQMKKTIEILADQMQSVINKPATKNPEFEMYAAKVKDSIRTLISQGKTNKAAEFIKAYEKLCPEDTEIDIFKKQI